jgi:hypothetical protein
MNAAPLLLGKQFSWQDGSVIRRGIVEAVWAGGRTGYVRTSPNDRVQPNELVIVHADPAGEIERAESHQVDLVGAEALALQILSGKTPSGSVTGQLGHLASALVMLLANERATA